MAGPLHNAQFAASVLNDHDVRGAESQRTCCRSIRIRICTSGVAEAEAES